MLTVLKQYPSGVNLLLASAFVLTLGRAITLPYLVLYLSKHYQLSIAAVGTTVGCALVAGSLLSLYGGYLTDRLKPYPLILGFTGCFVAAFIGMCVTSNLILFFLALVLFNFAYSVIDITAKAAFGRLLPSHEQSRVFSLRYTLINMAYAVGPFIGAALAGVNMSLPFVLSAALGAGFFWLYIRYGDRELGCAPAQTTPFSFAQVGKVLLNDRRLVCFTLGGILSAVVFGQFSAYLSQYLVVTSDPQRVYSVITTLLAVNACGVITLQYWVGKRIDSQHLTRWLMAGLALFLAGLAGFSMAQSLTAWAFAMLLFTLGEIIVFPAEYMFIDRIAPASLRGMYFAAQNLSNLGGALGPIVCGLVLAVWPAPMMFYVLAGFLIVGGGLYLLGGSLSETRR
ncbi:MFS transporter [Pseudomonas sp. LJDD11]|uniref:MFS transporter n=1 Tax=Pseudomonas sp. LJDD11 TaxID=2931984 RepID=UPI00211C8B97|nr:MFS transporter [Pseudomonas sp. LJDD11]MCQ9422980.1 MFS transporter [Pseudomonas sp. LJDD11]